MKFLKFLRSRRKDHEREDSSFEEHAARIQAEFEAHDFLGKAAAASSTARTATAEGRLDDAWRKYHEVKQHYQSHAARCGFTPEQTLALDGKVSKPLANILRLEKRHRDAFVHILYWVASSEIETKEQEQKLKAYFNRCRFQERDLEDARTLINKLRPLPDFREIRDAVARWEEEDRK